MPDRATMSLWANNSPAPPLYSKTAKDMVADAEEERLDDLVDEWHKGGSGVTLREYLGMSPEEYEYWLKNSASSIQ
jgi:hypothetical protein